MSRQPALNCRLERWCAWTGAAAPCLAKAPPGGLWLGEGEPDVSFLPAMQRRRLSPLARAAFAVARPCLGDAEPVPLVCSSAHGEMRRSVELLSTLADDQPLSPMSFSLSVHNAIAGQLSIALDNRAPVLALAPGDEGLAAALIEACGLLWEGAERVVVVWYDEPLPQPYHVFGAHEPQRPAALALRLGRGDSGGAALHLDRQPAPVSGEQPPQLAQLLDWLVGGATDFYTEGHAARWHWRLAA